MFFYWITGKYQIITFEEYILIALYADRIVGIYPEIKNPIFINQHVSSSDMTNYKEILLMEYNNEHWCGNISHQSFVIQVKWSGGKKFEDKFVEMLLKYGYKGEYMSEDWLKQPLFIQSFAPTSLIYISNMTNSPKLFLIDDTTIPTQDTNQVPSLVSTDIFMHVPLM